MPQLQDRIFLQLYNLQFGNRPAEISPISLMLFLLHARTLASTFNLRTDIAADHMQGVSILRFGPFNT